MSDNTAQDTKQPTKQPVEDTQEAEKGGILPEGWSTEDKPDPNDAYFGKYGNAAGQSIQSTLGKVGEPLGTGLNYAARPVGGLVEPIVGGLMGSGKAFDGLVKEEYGKPNTEDVKAELARGEGGEEQSAGNPLGLKGDAKTEGEGK